MAAIHGRTQPEYAGRGGRRRRRRRRRLRTKRAQVTATNNQRTNLQKDKITNRARMRHLHHLNGIKIINELSKKRRKMRLHRRTRWRRFGDVNELRNEMNQVKTHTEVRKANDNQHPFWQTKMMKNGAKTNHTDSRASDWKHPKRKKIGPQVTTRLILSGRIGWTDR